MPKQIINDFIKTYEKLSPMVVPRSAQLIEADDEFSLYAVTLFKRHSQEFIHKCRESKWTPRDFKYEEGGREQEKRDAERVGKDERKVWNEALRLGRTAWGEAVMAWIHVLALRVFVETVLRYGLPLSFVSGLVRVSITVPIHSHPRSNLTWTFPPQTTPKLIKKARGSLDASYSYLGGNAVGRDKKGRVTKDDNSTSAEMQAAGHIGDGQEYSAYVCYEFEIL